MWNVKLGEMSTFYYSSQVYFIYIAQNHKFASKGFNASYDTLHPSILIQISKRKKKLFDVEKRKNPWEDQRQRDPSSRTGRHAEDAGSTEHTEITITTVSVEKQYGSIR